MSIRLELEEVGADDKINAGILAGDCSDHCFEQLVFHQPIQTACFACRESLKTNLLSKEYRRRGHDIEDPQGRRISILFLVAEGEYQNCRHDCPETQ